MRPRPAIQLDPTPTIAAAATHEPCRTLLGHFRHERLVRDHATQLPQFRTQFSDERADFAKSLQRHCRQGPPPGWALTFVSS
ncbi:putative zinc-binding metallopeptidase [Variovorax gracilis]|uniref:putative zinc-binding metallopeptidase n=1 Tax=Variovorax gracilis TaxID=3053502 RepID=UPI00336BD19A